MLFDVHDTTTSKEFSPAYAKHMKNLAIFGVPVMFRTCPPWGMLWVIHVEGYILQEVPMQVLML